MPIALKVAVAIGSLFIINHGAAFAQGQMTHDRWVSAAITYAVPYNDHLPSWVAEQIND